MKRRVRTMAAVAGAFAAGVVVGPVVAAWAQDGGRADTYRLLNLFGDVFERVRAEYVEPINDRDAVENAINGMLTGLDPDRKSTRLNSSHANISYAVFCLKKKTNI